MKQNYFTIPGKVLIPRECDHCGKRVTIRYEGVTHDKNVCYDCKKELEDFERMLNQSIIPTIEEKK